MKLKTSIIIVTLCSLGTYFLFESNDMRNINNFNLLLNISWILIAIGIIGFIIYLLTKENTKIKKVIIGLFIISLAISSYVGFYKYQFNNANNILSEYYEIETCGEMETRFLTDLKKGEIKYFKFGLGFDSELQKTLNSNYGIQSFGMGCLVESKFYCYNNLVNNYLKEKYNDGIIED